MGVEALTRTADGEQIMPSTAADWTQWVSATATRNYVLGDPLLDWLNLYGTEHGLERDEELQAYDRRTDFTEFIFEQGSRFEAAVLHHLRTLTEVVTLASDRGDVRDLSVAERTFDAMRKGAPVIYQGVLWDAEHRTYGLPDLLIRSDVLVRLFPGSLSELDAQASAPDLGVAQLHYRVVDVKFSTLHFSADGSLGNSGSAPAYKVQLFIYNRALGRIQGFEPEAAYVLGRGWDQTARGITSRGVSCMERLAPVGPGTTLAKKRPIAEATYEACQWIRELRGNGQMWRLFPDPTRPELYPDSGNPQDGPWHAAKRRIAEELQDLTLLWQVGVPGRAMGHRAGVYRWRDERCTPATVGVTGPMQPAALQALMDVNRTTEGPAVRPARIRAAESEWRAKPALEFYVDFETVSDLADDFSSIPKRGGQTMIYMIGCGHVEENEWEFKCFVARDLTELSESLIIDAWLDHMAAVRQRVAPHGAPPTVIHWSPAEVSNFEKAYNSARARHSEKDWPSPRWFDFLNRVVKAEPVTVRGAMAFGLKTFANAMHQQRCVETLWGDGPSDGLGAMVGAWWCQGEAKRTGVPLGGVDLMKKIMEYNEVDCRVMMEAVRYLREHH